MWTADEHKLLKVREGGGEGGVEAVSPLHQCSLVGGRGLEQWSVIRC